MKPKMKYGLLALALVALASVSVASAHGFGATQACNDDMAVGDCRTGVHDARAAASHERCVEENGEDFCAEFAAMREEHAAERQALYDEYGVDPKPRHHRGHW